MAAPTLTEEQRLQLLEWLAADHPAWLIKQWFKERKWPALSDVLIHYYRHTYPTDLLALREARRATALTTGYAVRENRIAALQANAEALEAIKWKADRKTGRLWNEKAWRETLDDIARETGGRVQKVEAALGGLAGAPPIREVVIQLHTREDGPPDAE